MRPYPVPSITSNRKVPPIALSRARSCRQSHAKPLGNVARYADRATLDAVRIHCDAFAECYSERNFVYSFVNRFTGKVGVNVDNAKIGADKNSDLVWIENHYYPSPEMHEDAVPPLLEAIRSLGLS
ncbi:MAG: hypothetical protein ABW039_03970 [Sphingobium sp.]